MKSLEIEKESRADAAEQYRINGVACSVLRAAGVDLTGDRIDGSGAIVPESPTETVMRLVEHIRTTNPDGIRLLQQVGIEV